MTSNNLNGFLVAYSRNSLPQFISYAPNLANFSTDFSSDIQDGGSSIVTRLSTTSWTANDTNANGYVAQAVSSSTVTVALVQRDVTEAFSELQWAVSIPEVLINTFAGPQALALANTVAVDLVASLTGSANIGMQNIKAASTYTYFSASLAAAALDKAFVPRSNRTLILCPDAMQALQYSLSPTYIYGNPSAVQNYDAIRIQGFDTYQFGGIKDAPYNMNSSNTLNSTAPFISGSTVFGVALHKSALALAARAPLAVSNGLVEAVNVEDPTSKFPMQFRTSYLQGSGQWQLSATAIYGAKLGNPYGGVLIVT